jgi:hypothetical protein
MSWVAVGVAVVGTGVSYYNSQSTKSAAKKNADAIFGSKPEVAPFTPTNLMDEQRRAIDSNLSNASDLDRLLESILPGYTTSRDQGMKNANAFLRGELPDDVKNGVMRNNAYQSLIGGFSGSPMGAARGVRDLGLTSLQAMEQGGNTAQAWARTAMQTASPWLVTTPMQAAMTADNNRGVQNQLQLEYNVKASPDPVAAGLFNVNTAADSQFAGSVAGAANTIGNAYTSYQNRQAAPPNYGQYAYLYGNGTFASSGNLSDRPRGG